MSEYALNFFESEKGKFIVCLPMEFSSVAEEFFLVLVLYIKPSFLFNHH